MTETFGNVTTEAMASGLAVLAFNDAAAAQLIRHGENGCRVEVGDTAGFVREAQALAADAALRARLGQAARISMGALDWDGVAARFEAVLLGALLGVTPR